jgi:spore coat protein CotH
MLVKRKSGLAVALIVAVLTGSLLNSSPANAGTSYIEGSDAAAVMFNPLMVNDFSMQMSQEDFDSLREPNVSWDYEGDWRETRMSFTMAGKIYGPYVVGVHLKGAWGSWRDVSGKAAFKIKMDAYVPDQTLFGVSRITLNNMVQDPSYVHESLTYRLFRALGIPSPRTGYANVSLNGINYGLHVNVETPNKQMLKRWGISSKHLYKGAVPYFPDFYSGSEWMFAIESGSETNTADLTNFLAINELEGDIWWNEMSKIMDMELLTLGWATEYFTGHWDGYVLNRNNFFVNFDDNGRVLLLPWGVDQTWGGSLDYGSSPALMTNKCWAYERCLETYRQSMAKVARISKGLDLPGMSRNISIVIKPHIITDEFGPGIYTAIANQNYLLWRLREQQTVLNSIVQPFDTTLASVRVNGISYNPGQQVFLAPGTKTVSLSVTTSQVSAKSAIQPVGTLRSGINSAWVVVTSADKQHINSYKIPLYVYTNQIKKATISFHANSAVPTFSGLSNTGLLGTDIENSTNLSLDVRMLKAKTTPTAKAKALMANRVKYLLASLSNRGIKPVTVTQSLVSTGSANNLAVSATYKN